MSIYDGMDALRKGMRQFIGFVFILYYLIFINNIIFNLIIKTKKNKVGGHLQIWLYDC